MTVSIDTIRDAARTIEGAVVRTPLVRSGPLSALTGAEVYLKLETLQYTGSFKDRGALVKLASLTPAQAKNGVIAVSAGNHAQGVAYHARRLGIPATIVMPVNTPFTKINRTEALGARVLLHADTVSSCMPFAEDIMRKEKLTFVHPFDDPHIIAGQGTVGLEILDDLPAFDAMIVPVGGGGLISGIATAVAASGRKVEIVGVEAALYPSMRCSLRGETIPAGGATLAEGIAIKTPGTLTLPIVRTLVDDVVVADELPLEDAVQTMICSAKVLAEGAGAAPLAALSAMRDRFLGKTVVLVVSGANIDFRDSCLGPDARHGAQRPDGPPARDHQRHAGHPGARGAADWRARRQHRRDRAPAAVLRCAGQAGGRRHRDRNPGRRPHRRDHPASGEHRGTG